MHRKTLEIAAALLVMVSVVVGYPYIRGMIMGANLEEQWAALAARETLDATTRKAVLWIAMGVVWLLVVKILKDLLDKRKAAGEWLETLLTKPPLLDLVYALSAAFTIMKSPRRNIKEFTHRVRLHQTTPISTRHISENRRLSLQQFVCTLTCTTEDTTRCSLETRSISRLRGECLYNIVRRLKPSIVVETGTAGGHMSWYILQALSENDKGLLVSTDLPDYKPEYYREPKGSLVGYLVPKELRGRWELLLEDSHTSLPRVSEAHEIDLFVHDSLHTYDHMMFEFETVWPHLVPGGILLAHDADKAFVDFAQRVERPYWVWERYGGIVKGEEA